MALFVDDAQIKHRQTLMLNLDVINMQDSVLSHSREYSFWVIPGTIPAEFEFHSKFCWNCLISLVGPWAKIDSIGILGIAQIPTGTSGGQ